MFVGMSSSVSFGRDVLVEVTVEDELQKMIQEDRSNFL